jgi:hypothetical protein
MKNKMIPIQIYVPAELVAKLKELREHGFSPSAVIREAAVHSVNSKLEKARRAGL